MLFNSLHFLIFFPVVVLLYYALSQKYRWLLLLGASYYFYMSWKPEYVVVLFIATLTNYLCARLLFTAKNVLLKRLYLLFGAVGSVGLLFFFKYFNFFNSSLGSFIEVFSIPFSPFELEILLPVGISFFTFQTVGYTIDVYWGRRGPERHFGIFALYVSFFPQLVAGPIERAKNLLPQFSERKLFNYQQGITGLKMIIWGYFMKVVVAERLPIYVNAVYNNPDSHAGATLLVATFFFAIQILISNCPS